MGWVWEGSTPPIGGGLGGLPQKIFFENNTKMVHSEGILGTIPTSKALCKYMYMNHLGRVGITFGKKNQVPKPVLNYGRHCAPFPP